jgi:hypothetical protein
MGEMRVDTNILLESLKRREHSKDIGVYEKIILKQILGT